MRQRERRRRGKVAGLIPVKSIAEMTGLGFLGTRKLLYKECRRIGKKLDDWTFRELGDFLYAVRQCQELSLTDTDDYGLDLFFNGLR